MNLIEVKAALTDAITAIDQLQTELLAAQTERDAALVRLAQLNAAIDAAQGQLRFRIELPSNANSAERQFADGYEPTLGWLQGHGFPEAREVTGMPLMFEVSVAEKPEAISLSFSLYDSANLAWGDWQPMTVEWFQG